MEPTSPVSPGGSDLWAARHARWRGLLIHGTWLTRAGQGRKGTDDHGAPPGARPGTVPAHKVLAVWGGEAGEEVSDYASETELQGLTPTQVAGAPGREGHTAGGRPPGAAAPELAFGDGAGL